MDNSVKISFIVAGTLIVVALIAYFAVSQFMPAKDILTTQGIAEVKTLPDIVAVYLNVETNGTTAIEAKDKNSQISEAVTNSLLNLGLDKKDITTQNYNIYEEFSYSNDGTRKSIGFKATNQFRIELKGDKIDLAGKVIDSGVNAGATVSYINFELSLDLQNQYKIQALKLATEDAKTKADAIASGLGKKTGKVVSVSTSDFSYRPWPLFAESAGGVADAKAAVTSIQPGERSVSASVSVTYKLA